MNAEIVRSPYLTKTQVAQLFGITVRTLELWMRRGFLPFLKIGRAVRFRQSDIDAALTQRCLHNAQEAA